MDIEVIETITCLWTAGIYVVETGHFIFNLKSVSVPQLYIHDISSHNPESILHFGLLALYGWSAKREASVLPVEFIVLKMCPAVAGGISVTTHCSIFHPSFAGGIYCSLNIRALIFHRHQEGKCCRAFF